MKKVAKVAEVVATVVPGPIGVAAGAISAGAYAATGNRRKALEMSVIAAAAMVPGGGAAARAGIAAAKAGGRVASKVGQSVSKVRRSGCGSSFTPNTPVLMADGTRQAISDIDVGDFVAARDPLTGEMSAQPVLNTIVSSGDKHLIGVTTARGPPGASTVPGGEDTWTATANHPIWVEGAGWITAEALRIGDVTVGAGGEQRTVSALTDYGWLQGQTVRNLTVANAHTYVVGDVDAGTLVHNASCAKQGGVYALVAGSGRVVRTGKTNNLVRREAEHGRRYVGLDFVILAKSNSRTVRSVLEQAAHQRYRPILNRVSPIAAARHKVFTPVTRLLGRRAR